MKRNKAPDLAQQTLVRRRVPVALDADDAIIAHDVLHPAAHTTGHAGRLDPRDLIVRPHIGAGAVHQRAGGADLQAVATGHTARLAKRHIQIGDDHRVSTAVLEPQRVIAHQVAADANATAAEDAAVMVHHKVLARGVDGQLGKGAVIAPMVDPRVIGQILQLATTAHLAEHAKVVALRKEQLQHKATGVQHLLRIGMYHHAIGHGKGTGWLEDPLFLNLHKADAAGSDRLDGRVCTQRRDLHPCRVGSIEDRAANRHHSLLVIDRYAYIRHNPLSSCDDWVICERRN